MPLGMTCLVLQIISNIISYKQNISFNLNKADGVWKYSGTRGHVKKKLWFYVNRKFRYHFYE
jgi:hypothetical protein